MEASRDDVKGLDDSQDSNKSTSFPRAMSRKQTPEYFSASMTDLNYGSQLPRATRDDDESGGLVYNAEKSMFVQTRSSTDDSFDAPTRGSDEDERFVQLVRWYSSTLNTSLLDLNDLSAVSPFVQRPGLV